MYYLILLDAIYQIAVAGCVHGRLNNIYETLEFIKHERKIDIDLLLCCGDFQSIRD